MTVLILFGLGFDAFCGPQLLLVKIISSSPFKYLGMATLPCNRFSPCQNHIPWEEVCFRYRSTYFAASKCPCNGFELNWLNRLYTVLMSGRVLMVNQFILPTIDWYYLTNFAFWDGCTLSCSIRSIFSLDWYGLRYSLQWERLCFSSIPFSIACWKIWYDTLPCSSVCHLYRCPRNHDAILIEMWFEVVFEPFFYFIQWRIIYQVVNV